MSKSIYPICLMICMLFSKQVFATESPNKIEKVLRAGNDLYVKNLTVNTSQKKNMLAIEGQSPIVTILSCSDSRVPINEVFDLSIGNAFNIRVAGNIVNEDIIGTIEYGIMALNIPVLMIMGHTECGAVDAKISNISKLPSNIMKLVTKVSPGQYDNLKQATINNIKNSAKLIIESSSTVKDAVSKGKLKIIKALYHIDSGKVEFL